MKRRFLCITYLFITILMSLVSFQTFAAPNDISGQTDLSNFFNGLFAPNANINVINDIQLDSTWSPITTIEEMNIFTNGNSFEISLNSDVSRQFLVTENQLSITLDEYSIIKIANFTNFPDIDSDTLSRGGAIFAKEALSFAGGKYIFSNNVAKSSGINSSESSGGAIFNSYDTPLELIEGSYIFEKNSSAIFNPINSVTGMGGAISTNSINLSGRNFVFIDNEVTAVSDYENTTADGGAIFASNNITLLGGIFEFKNNTVLAKINIPTSDSTAFAFSGALKANNVLEFDNGNYYFTQNSATAISQITLSQGGAITGGYGAIKLIKGYFNFKNNSSNSGYLETANDIVRAESDGGAIYSTNINIHDGDFIFSKNTATSDIGSNEGTVNAYGGAIYTKSTFKINDGNFVFKGNLASAASSGMGESNGAGGAIYVANMLVINNGFFVFKGNKAYGTSGISNNGNGAGGAIYSFYNITLENGTYIFKNNEAIGTNNDIFASSYSNGGGAIYSRILNMSGGDYVFISNSAVIGGAICITEELNIVGGKFLNNIASEFGGAIFVNSTFESIVDIVANETNSVIFEGNRQKDELNSIFFYNQASANIQVSFTVEENSIFLMKDPMSSNEKGTLSILKTGNGIWQLGGANILRNTVSTFDISAGFLKLLANSSINLTGNLSEFSVSNQAGILVVANTSPVNISANSIELNCYMGISDYENFSFANANMESDNRIVLMHMNARDSLTCTSININQPDLSGIITIRAYDYEYAQDPLRWTIDTLDITHGILSLQFENKKPNPQISLKGADRIPALEMLFDDTSSNTANHMFDLLTKGYLLNNNIWLSSSAGFNKFDTISITRANFTIGIDRLFLGNILTGLALSTNIYNYKESLSNETYITANSVNPILSMYAGTTLFSRLNFGCQISYGLNLINRHRDLYDESYQALYISNIFKASVNFEYLIRFNKITISPIAGYEYSHLFVNDHNEKSLSNLDPINAAVIYGADSQNIHKIDLGFNVTTSLLGINLKASLSYRSLFGDLNSETVNRFVYDESVNIDAIGLIAANHNFCFSIEAITGFSKNADISIQYNGMINKYGFAHTIKLGVSYGF